MWYTLRSGIPDKLKTVAINMDTSRCTCCAELSHNFRRVSCKFMNLVHVWVQVEEDTVTSFCLQRRYFKQHSRPKLWKEQLKTLLYVGWTVWASDVRSVCIINLSVPRIQCSVRVHSNFHLFCPHSAIFTCSISLYHSVLIAFHVLCFIDHPVWQ